MQQKKEEFLKNGQGGPAFEDQKEIGSVFEPKVAEMIFDRLVEEAGVKVIKLRLDLKKEAVMPGKRIKAIVLEDGSR